MDISYKKYNALIAAGLIAVSALYLAAYNMLGYFGMPMQKIPHEILYLYQQDKAAHSRADLIFVGDSSLGNAIDAQSFSGLSGHRAENFALTGSFGYRGSLDMLKTVQARDPALKTVILMQTADMMTRADSPPYRPSRKIFGVDFDVFNYATLRIFFKTLTGDSEKNAKLKISNDYIAQGNPLPAEKIFRPLSANALQSAGVAHLKSFAAFCREKGLKCVYIHGPLVEDNCRDSAAYFEVLNPVIEQTGLLLVKGAPICIPRDKLGDASDHVRRAYRTEFTKRYYELLKLYLD